MSGQMFKCNQSSNPGGFLYNKCVSSTGLCFLPLVTQCKQTYLPFSGCTTFPPLAVLYLI